MNDLTEKALHALNVAQAEVRGRPVIALATSGFLVSCVIVFAAARGAAARATESISPWFGLLHSSGTARTDNVAGLVTLAGIITLILLWLAALFALRSSHQPESRAWMIAAAWATPFAVGPPIMDTHVYLDVARGLLQRAGHDPYIDSVAGQTHVAILGSIDPSLRGLPSGTGPLTTLIQHLVVAASGGHELGAVILLRLAALVAVIALGRSALDLAGTRRTEALALTVLNPLILLYGIGAAHLDVVVASLLVAALVAANQRRWIRAIVLTSLAASILPVALVVVPVIAAAHARSRQDHTAWRIVGRDLGEAAVILGGFGFAVRSGFRWMANASDQFPDYTPYAPANVVGKILRPFVPGASFDDLAAGGRITALIAVGSVLVYLVLSARSRPIDLTAGYALLATALLAPDVQPWFAIWPIACLAPSATGMRRSIVIVLSAAAALLDLPGFSDRVSVRFGVAAIIVGAAALAVALWRQREPTDPAAVRVV